MQLPNNNGEAGDQVATSTAKLPTTIYCTFCGEMADGYNSVNQPVCGIPGNHPGYDDEIVQPME